MLYLFNSLTCLKIRVVSGIDFSNELFLMIIEITFKKKPGSDGTHRGWLITSVGLSRIFKVWIRSSRTVHTYVSSHINVRTSVRLAHNSDNCNLKEQLCKSHQNLNICIKNVFSTPLAVRIGLAFNLGTNIFLYSRGTAAMMSTNWRWEKWIKFPHILEKLVDIPLV